METELTINGIVYVPKSEVNSNVVSVEGLPYVIVRTYSAGVHYGYLKDRTSTLAGIEVTLINAQRLRYWKGAMDLSQLATDGTKEPSECKPSVVASEISLVAIEILPISEKALKTFKLMSIWKS